MQVSVQSVAYQEPEYSPWDGRRVPMTFVGGYLGAGKTTIINEVLAAADRPIAVIVNDVGSINIDASLIRRHSGGLIEVTNGCVCCSSIEGMGAALDQLRARTIPPDHVVVELSGVADPQRMLPWSQSAGFALDGLVVVVAADQLVTAALPEWVQEQLHTAITAADMLILTKCDVMPDKTAADAKLVLRGLANDTPVLVSERGSPITTSAAQVLRLGARRPSWLAPGLPDIAPATLFDAHEVTVVPFPSPTTLDKLTKWLAEFRARTPGLVRAKGIAVTTDSGLVLVQVVGVRIETSKLRAPEYETATDLVAITLRPGRAS